MKNLATHLNVNATPQTQPILGRESEMKKNNAGGFVFTVHPLQQLRRFCILGSEKGTYYSSEKKVTLDNAKNIINIFQSPDGVLAVNEIVTISDQALAPKNDYAIFALAIGYKFGNAEVKAAITENFNRVIRIGTHLFQFYSYLEELGLQKLSGSTGRQIKKAISAWYNNKSADSLALQVLKYANRAGWTHEDVLNLTHIKLKEDAQVIGKYLINRIKPDYVAPENLPELIKAFEFIKSKGITDPKVLVPLIEKHKLPRELLPTEALNSPEIWEALLPHMGLTAMIRNLGKLTAVGLLKPLSAASKLIVNTLGDKDRLMKERIHPFGVLLAERTYAAGHGHKGKLTWTPVSAVRDALEGAFYEAFQTVTPTGQNILIGLDVSGSMGSPILGSSISAREAAAAMAMVIARTEKNYQIMAFSNRFMPLDIKATDSLNDVLRKTGGLPFESTDCSLPMQYATKGKLDVDAFIVMTDNETYAGSMQPSQALAQFRKAQNKPRAKQAVIAFSSTEFTIADPKDPLTMDFAGFDASAPAVLSDFLSEKI